MVLELTVKEPAGCFGCEVDVRFVDTNETTAGSWNCDLLALPRRMIGATKDEGYL
jgi:hypothetical protein